MSNVKQIRWETVPQSMSRLITRYICYFKTRGERRATKGDKRGRPSTTMWRERKKRAELKRLTSFDKCICDRENLVFDSLIYFEPVDRFKNKSNVRKFMSFGDSTSSRVEDKLKLLFPLVKHSFLYSNWNPSCLHWQMRMCVSNYFEHDLPVIFHLF